ncbi:hypothetical protein GCM10010363_22170 [Streptomyces omiyaensis]|nr:hypothetical protein GCM10010363_22170 [Streptomyces omiyaensis]
MSMEPRVIDRPEKSRYEILADASGFARVLPEPTAADVEPQLAAVLAVSRRPLAARAFGEAAPVAAWKTKPSWVLVASADRPINPGVERYGYERAGKTTVEVDSSHLAMLAQPKAVTGPILAAARPTGH